MARLITLSDAARSNNYDLSSNQNDIYDPSGKTAYGTDGTKVGTVTSAMVDANTGRIRYLIVDTGGWFFSKEVLVPVGLARIEDDGVYFDTLTKDQVKGMREYRAGEDITEEDESANLGVLSGKSESDRVLGAAYTTEGTGMSATRTSATGPTGTETMATGSMSTGSSTTDMGTVGMAGTASTSRRFDYRDEDTTDTLFKTPQRLQLLEERLNVNKVRERVGEVEVGKRVETHTEKVSVPLEREEIVIERHPVTGGQAVTGATLGAATETIRVELEAERAQVSKQAFVTEEVEIGKRTLTETQTVTETLGKEVLEVERSGQLTSETTATTGVRDDRNLIEKAGDAVKGVADRVTGRDQTGGVSYQEGDSTNTGASVNSAANSSSTSNKR